MATTDLSSFNIDRTVDYSTYSIAVVAAEWNENITKNLLRGCINTLKELGVEKISKKWVPGSYELPMAAQFLLESTHQYDAIICLGCVIQGQTKHFDTYRQYITTVY